MINARSETAHALPAFRDAMKYRRCLVPADGFYEWKRSTDGKQPYCFEVRDGESPRVANMLVSSYLRPAAVKAGVIGADWDGRFGFHNLRHSLGSYLVRSKTDPKTVQALLRHSGVRTTLQLYSRSVSEDRMLAQGSVLQAILGMEPTEAD